MKKQAYLKPALRVVRIQHQGIICTSDVKKAINNVGLKEEILGGSSSARARGFGGWDDEGED